MLRSEIHAVIFDMDGVLIDSEPLHERAQRIVFRRHAIEVPDRVYSDFKGQTEEDVFEYVVREFGRDGHDPAVLVREKHSAYRELLNELEPIDGALELLQYLSGVGMPLALTTSAIRRDQEFAFDRLQLGAFFKVVVTADDVTRPKPDPEPYRITALKLGKDSTQCLVVEDSLNGVRSAAGAGCKVAGITTSFPADSLVAAGAEVVVDRLLDLKQLC